MNKTVQKILEKIKRDKRIAAIVCIGLVGIILLTLSELMPQKSDVKQSEKSENTTDIRDSYEEDIEKRLTSIVSSINGAGRTEVMVTLASGDENVYAVKEKSSDGSKEREYIVIDSDKNESGLLLKVIEPEIRGVAIVCEGADSAKVRQEIISSVSAVLGISTNRISIAKIKSAE
ncbi:MAG TPA: hypothetical protein DIW36_08620 [Ruminococcaceae bacterium]|nr:hypothetical protein [Oscillospiraceae bacterium]